MREIKGAEETEGEQLGVRVTEGKGDAEGDIVVEDEGDTVIEMEKRRLEETHSRRTQPSPPDSPPTPPPIPPKGPPLPSLTSPPR